MGIYRRRLTHVEAWQWNGSDKEGAPNWFRQAVKKGSIRHADFDGEAWLELDSVDNLFQGKVAYARAGDFIVRAGDDLQDCFYVFNELQFNWMYEHVRK